MAGGVNFGGEFKELGDVLAGGAASDEDGGVGEEVKILFKAVKDAVGVGNEVGFGEDDDDAFAGVDDLTGEGLVKLGVGFGGVHQERANVSFFNSSEGAESGELLNADFAFAGTAEASGI